MDYQLKNRMVKIGLVSFNTDGLKKTNPAIVSMLSDKLFSDIRPDIYVEATQEDARNPSEPLIGYQRIADYTHAATAALNTKATAQNAILKVYVNSNTLPEFVATNTKKGSFTVSPKESKQYVLGLQKVASAIPGIGFGFTKGATFVRLNLGDKGNFIFVNMHLPVSTSKYKKGELKGSLKDPTLGVEYRGESLKELLTKIQPYVDERTTVIVTGDLNFRMDFSGMNQLTSLLPGFTSPFTLQEIDTLGKEIFTCKFKSKSNRDCRIRSIPPRNNSYSNSVLAHQAECGDPERIPSRCDRVLYHLAPGLSIKTLKYDVDVLDIESDHNAIFATLEVGPAAANSVSAPVVNSVTEASTLHPPAVGGRRKTSKRRKSLKKRKSRRN